MRIAVVENEQEERRHICSCITEYFRKRGISAELCQYGDGEEIAKAARESFDVIFMDIDMEGLDGMAAAKRIRTYDRQVMIVFITNMAGYAIDGYSVQALDFLVKPVSALRMEEELDRILEFAGRRNPGKIAVKGDGKLYQIDINDIFYVEMYGRKIRLHRRQGILEVNGTLRYFEERLARGAFFRCHQAFLVNLAYVSSIGRCDLEVEGDLVPVSRQRKKALSQAFARYLGGSL
ncbi:MAG: response regulator transcription factor [Hungatella sp.]|nr:response regulator transcription factor [Hungatella sp.]